MVPPGLTHTSKDSDVGPMTILTNNTEKGSVFAVYVLDNPEKKKLTNETARLYLDNFMQGAGISTLPGVEPAILSDGIMMYGTSGDQTAGVYVLSTDEKVTILTGMYPTMDNATADVENLAMIAATITISPV